MNSTAKVTIRVEINGEVKEFEATAETGSNVHRVAKGLLGGLQLDAGQWIDGERWNTAD